MELAKNQPRQESEGLVQSISGLELDIVGSARYVAGSIRSEQVLSKV